MPERGRTDSVRASWLLAILILALPATSIVLAHGGEKHESTEDLNSKNTEAPADRSLSSSQARREAEQELLKKIGQDFEEKVKPIFMESCYDCHSDQTNHPWYYNIPIVQDMIDEDIAEAKKHLNFTRGFPFQGHGGPREDLTAIRETLEKDEMPPWNYKLMHSGSRLDEREAKIVREWIMNSLKHLNSVEKPR